MKKLKIKGIVSTLLLLTVLFLAVSGTMLYFGKTGMILGIARGDWRGVHAIVAIIMCALLVTHLFLNRKIYFNELKSLLKRSAKK